MTLLSWLLCKQKHSHPIILWIFNLFIRERFNIFGALTQLGELYSFLNIDTSRKAVLLHGTKIIIKKWPLFYLLLSGHPKWDSGLNIDLSLTKYSILFQWKPREKEFCLRSVYLLNIFGAMLWKRSMTILRKNAQLCGQLCCWSWIWMPLQVPSGADI